MQMGLPSRVRNIDVVINKSVMRVRSIAIRLHWIMPLLLTVDTKSWLLDRQWNLKPVNFY